MAPYSGPFFFHRCLACTSAGIDVFFQPPSADGRLAYPHLSPPTLPNAYQKNLGLKGNLRFSRFTPLPPPLLVQPIYQSEKNINGWSPVTTPFTTLGISESKMNFCGLVSLEIAVFDFLFRKQ